MQSRPSVNHDVKRWDSRGNSIAWSRAIGHQERSSPWFRRKKKAEPQFVIFKWVMANFQEVDYKPKCSHLTNEMIGLSGVQNDHTKASGEMSHGGWQPGAYIRHQEASLRLVWLQDINSWRKTVGVSVDLKSFQTAPVIHTNKICQWVQDAVEICFDFIMLRILWV